MKSPDDNKDETFQLELDALFRRHLEVLHRLAYRLTGNPDDAEDVVQMVFVKVIQRKDAIEFRRNPMAYLHRSVTHQAISFFRSRDRGRFADEDVSDLEVEAPTGESSQYDELDFDLLRSAMMRLKPEFIETLNLYYMEGHSCLEIARIRGKPVGTVTVDLYRARAVLKRRLKKRLKRQETNRETEQTKHSTDSSSMLAGPSET